MDGVAAAVQVDAAGVGGWLPDRTDSKPVGRGNESRVFVTPEVRSDGASMGRAGIIGRCMDDLITRLDPATLLLAIAVFSSVLAAMTVGMVNAMPEQAEALKHWALGMLCSSLAFAGFFMRGHASPWITYLFANLAALGPPAFGLLAHARFQGVAAPPRQVFVEAIAGWSGPVAVHFFGAPHWVAVSSMSFAASLHCLRSVAVITKQRCVHNIGSVLSLAAFSCLGGVLALRGMTAAAGDSLPMESNSPMHLATLLVGCLYVMTSTLGFVLMLSERQRQLALESARRDGLTGVLARTAFMEEARVHLESGRGAALLMVDLDHFKSVNDRYGHAGGDAVLMHAARRLVGRCRPTDLVGRYGGEEFCVLLRDADERTACEFAQRLVSDARSTSVRLPVGECRYTLSVGYVACPASEASSLVAALDRADAALYAAKRAGRDRAIAAEPRGNAPSPQGHKTGGAAQPTG